MADGWRVLGLSETYATMGAGNWSAPERWWEQGLGALLNELGPRFASSGVLVLDLHGAARLGLPTHPVPHGGIDHPALSDAERAGWKPAGRLSDWTRFRRDGQALAVTVAPMWNLDMDADDFTPETPFYRPSMAETVRTLDLWHQLTGVPWFGSPGMAGIDVLAHVVPPADPAKNRPPVTWRPTDPGPDSAYEPRYELSQWRNPPQELPTWVHGFDQNRAYIAAAMTALVCPWPLRPTGRIPFDRRRAGWWLCELAPWNDPRMPDPAGYFDEDTPGKVRVRWLTTQRVALLDDLTTEGVYGGVRIVDSRTGAGKDTILKPWAERMRDTYALRRPDGRALFVQTGDAEAVKGMAKEVGRRTLGALNTHDTGWVRRPDWWYATVAMQSVNLWRRCWQVGKDDDRWPFAIDVDNVYYAHKSREPREAVPLSLLARLDDTGERLGCFKTRHRFRYPAQRRTPR